MKKSSLEMSKSKTNLHSCQKSLKVGETFDDYEEYKQVIDSYCKMNNVLLIKSNSKTTNSTNKTIKNQMLYDDRFKYSYLKMACKHAGSARPQSVGIRPNQRSTKLNCPAHVTANVDRKLNKLVITSMVEEHNHEISREIYQSYPEVRRLSKEEISKAESLLELNVRCTELASYMSEHTAKTVTKKDMHNLKAKVKDKEKINLIDTLSNLSKEGGKIYIQMNDINELETLYMQPNDMNESVHTVLLDKRFLVHQQLYLYSVLVENNAKVVPLAYAFLKEEESFVTFLNFLKEANPKLSSWKSIMFNHEDKTETEVVRNTVPNVEVVEYAPHKRVMCNILSETGLSESNMVEIDKILEKVAAAENETVYFQYMRKLEALSSPEFMEVFSTQWHPKKHTWVRCFQREHNALLEQESDDCFTCFMQHVDRLLTMKCSLDKCVRHLLDLSQVNTNDMIKERETTVSHTHDGAQLSLGQNNCIPDYQDEINISCKEEDQQAKEKQCHLQGDITSHGTKDEQLKSLSHALTRYEKFIEMRVLLNSISDLCAELDPETYETRLKLLAELHESWKNGHQVALIVQKDNSQEDIKVPSDHTTTITTGQRCKQPDKPNIEKKTSYSDNIQKQQADADCQSHTKIEMLKQKLRLPTSVTKGPKKKISEMIQLGKPKKRRVDEMFFESCESQPAQIIFCELQSNSSYEIPLNDSPSTQNLSVEVIEEIGADLPEIAEVAERDIFVDSDVCHMSNLHAVAQYTEDLISNGTIRIMMERIKCINIHPREYLFEYSGNTPSSLYVEIKQLFPDTLKTVEKVLSEKVSIPLTLAAENCSAVIKILSGVVASAYKLFCFPEKMLETVWQKLPFLKQMEGEFSVQERLTEGNVVIIGKTVVDISALKDLSQRKVANKKVIDAYLALLQRENNHQLQQKSCFVLPQEIFLAWQEGNYERYLLKSRRLSGFDMLLLVLNCGENFALLVANLKDATIGVVNPISSDVQVEGAVEDLVVKHWSKFIQRRSEEVEESLPTLTWVSLPVIPFTSSASSSIYVLMAAEGLLSDLPPCVLRQCHIPEFCSYVHHRLTENCRHSVHVCDLASCKGLTGKNSFIECVFCGDLIHLHCAKLDENNLPKMYICTTCISSKRFKLR